MTQVVDGKMSLDPVQSEREGPTKHSCIEYQDVEGEVQALECLGKCFDAVERG